VKFCEQLESRTLLSSVVAVNAGGSNLTLDNGETFLADSGFTGGTIRQTPLDVSGTSDDALFNSRRYGPSFTFVAKVKNGTYRLKLYFCETYLQGPDLRSFSVVAEDQQVISDVDLEAKAGFAKALVESSLVTIRDKHLSIGFSASKGDAIISAIELEGLDSPGDREWNTWGAASPVGRYESAGVAVNGKLYVFGGYTNEQIQATPRSDMYDPATNTWTRIADMPEALTHSGQAVFGTTVWLAGGFVGDDPGPGTRHVWKYSTLSDTWKKGPALPEARGAGALALDGTVLHYFGGLTHANSSADPVTRNESDHWTLDLAGDGTWHTAAPLARPRNHLAGAAVGGFVYAVGGQSLWDEQNGAQAKVDRYDPTTDSWTPVAAMPIQVSHVNGSTFVSDGKIVVIGGATNQFTPLADVMVYDPKRNRWSMGDPIPAPRFAGVAAPIGSLFVVTMGSASHLDPEGTTWIGA